ncbi:MAG: aminotransferase class V-fold PLP-dependent enzyme [Acidobacteriota bacterium]|nr:MAG: aminotransferase class V-fold PLP-dependent enzyme [Acidobacteriota bacterium]
MTQGGNKGQEWERWRTEFPILEESVYLINNSLGAMPRQTPDALREYTRMWEELGVRAWEESWWNLPRVIGDLIASIIGAWPGTVSIQPNVTTSQWIALSCLAGQERKKIVYSELNFPSVRYFYQAQPDLQVEVVPCPDGMTVPVERMLDAIDENTLAVPISHVIFKSSFIQDVRAVVEKAHRVGAYVILDTYHSAGIVPFSLQELEVDFAVGGVLKWLCGGPGVAFLYVRPDLADRIAPQLTGWLAHERPFDFSPRLELSDGAYRFMSGTPNIPGLFAARRGLEIIQEVGVARIRERSSMLTEFLIAAADAASIPVRTPRNPRERGGHVTLSPERAESVSRHLLSHGFVIDYRPGAGIRVAPHFFNTRDELEHLVAEIGNFLERE